MLKLRLRDLWLGAKVVLPLVNEEARQAAAAERVKNSRTVVREERLPDGNDLLHFANGKKRIAHYDLTTAPIRKFGSPNVMPTAYGIGTAPPEIPTGVNELQGVGYVTPQRGVKLTDGEIQEFHDRQHRPGEPWGDAPHTDGVTFLDSPFGGRGEKV